MSRTSVVVAAPTFPALSETFVVREVRGLRNRQWPTSVLALRMPPQAAAAGDVADAVHFVYDEGLGRTAADALIEIAAHPLATARTLARALHDAVAPGEPMSLRGRLLTIVQGVVAVGAAHRLRYERPQHLHCHFAHASTTVGMYVARQLGVPFSFVGHANDLFQRRVLLKRKLARAAFVSCISQWHRDFYNQIRPAQGAEYRIIRCGVEVPDHPTAHAFDGTLRVLTVCRLVPKKGVDTLLAALALMNRTDLPHSVQEVEPTPSSAVAEGQGRDGIRCATADGGVGPTATLTIIGDGPQRAELEQQCRELGLAQHVIFRGAQAHDQVIAALGDADVVALPCRTDAAGDRDGIPVVLMEAMAQGVPVVAGDLPAIRELVDGTTGILVPPDDPTALAEALHRLATDADLRHRLSAAGRARVIEEFSLEKNLDRLEAAITWALAKHQDTKNAKADE